MISKRQYVLTGIGIFLCTCLSVNAGVRKQRQNDFLFPDEFKDFQNRGELGPDPYDFPDPDYPSPFDIPRVPIAPVQQRFPQQAVPQQAVPQQGFPQQGFPQQQGFQQQQGFPQQQGFQQRQQQVRPQQQARPQQQLTTRPMSTTTPMPMLTTPSPAFLACMANCPTTSEYNPICGTNRQLYFNQQKYDCALRCGAKVEIWRRGSCAGLFQMMRG